MTGDVHGDAIGRLSNANFQTAKTLDRSDLVFIAGDFGSVWCNQEDREERYVLNWLNDRPFTTMIIGGNHENWDRLRALPMVEKFGVQLGELRPNVFFVPNGTLIDYYGRKIFCFGGAMSTDKHLRVEGRDWWAGEIPTYEEMDFGTKNLETVDYEVDVIISHTMPIKSIVAFCHSMGYHEERQTDPTANYLSFIKEHTKYNEWYCGHFHMNKEFDGVLCLYEDIVEVGAPYYFSHGRKHIEPLW